MAGSCNPFRPSDPAPPNVSRAGWVSPLLFATQVGSPPNRLATVDGQLEVLYSDWNVIDRAQDDADGRSAGQWFPERVEWRLQAPEATATFWLRQPRRALEQQRWNRLFDLSRLREVCVPKRLPSFRRALTRRGRQKLQGLEPVGRYCWSQQCRRHWGGLPPGYKWRIHVERPCVQSHNPVHRPRTALPNLGQSGGV